MPFDPTVLVNDPDRRRIVLSMLGSALQAVDPAKAVGKALRLEGGKVVVAGKTFATSGVVVVAAGKAAPGMARAVCAALSPLPVRGVVVSDHSEQVPVGLDHRLASHPIPDERSVTAAREAVRLVEGAKPDELVLFLISGGGSALLELPIGGLALDHLVAVQVLMLRGGVPIDEMNAVRRHLSGVKGGRLAAVCGSSMMATLVMSDVSGRSPDVVASGPTLPDPSTFAEARAVLQRHGLTHLIPPLVLQHLDDGIAGRVAETPKADRPGHLVVVAADGKTAAHAACDAAKGHGLRATLITTTLSGEAREEALKAVSTANSGAISVFAGETTVNVTGDGRGGRNQEAALAASIALDGDPTVVFATCATDGVDGPTDAAGAIVDGGTSRRGLHSGLNAASHLSRNDSHGFLETTGDLLRTGPTGTNVGDIWLVWRG